MSSHQETELAAVEAKERAAPSTEAGLDEVLFRPVLETGKGFYLTVAVLLFFTALGVYAYLHQFRNGLGVTGLNKSVYWGIYITNFVFFVGISHAGTLISAILRISNAEWRRPITRSAEVITVMVLFFGVGSILIDLGRPDRLTNVLKFGRFQSPLLWDVTSITTYLIGSMVYLYLPLIPDLALIRDRIQGPWKSFYRVLALGYTGTPRQRHLLERLIGIMAVIIIPIAVSVHTVVSFVFAMTVQPMWHSAIFGPYFVAGAIFSGIAALIVAMAVLRKVYHLEDYLKPIHFNYLGILLLVMTMLWFYFTFSEFLTTWYGHEPTHMAVWWAKVSGPFAPYFWTMVLTCFVIPMIFLAPPRFRTIQGTVIASISVNIGMWLERYLIVVPTLANPRLPYGTGTYFGTWVEWFILIGCFAAFILLYALFTKFFPIVAIWEVREGRELALKEVHERVKAALPGEGRIQVENATET
ncbi:MAG: polysulfide reductase NrfD [Deferrisomatales bacterium]